MKIVLDASVALKWVLPEPFADKARQLRDDYENQVHELIAPDIFPAEIAHALARAERRRLVPVGDAEIHLVNILSTAPRFSACLPLLRRALSIASAMRAGAYDCLYVALAEREGISLVTADDKLVKNLQPHFPFIVALSSMP